MALLDGLLGPLEIALNRVLATSPQALEVLAAERDALQLSLRDLNWSFQLAPVKHGLVLTPVGTTPRASISTSLVGLARLAGGEDARSLGAALRIEGDAEYAEQIFTALRGAGVDWQAEMASLLGPGLLGRTRGWLDGGRDLLRDWLQHNAHAELVAAPDSAADVSMDALDQLAMQIDRCEARLARLEGQSR